MSVDWRAPPLFTRHFVVISASIRSSNSRAMSTSEHGLRRHRQLYASSAPTRSRRYINQVHQRATLPQDTLFLTPTLKSPLNKTHCVRVYRPILSYSERYTPLTT